MRGVLPACLVVVLTLPLAAKVRAQGPPVQPAPGKSNSVSESIAQGDFYQSKRKYDLAREAYQQADKLSHHTSALAYMKLVGAERKLGDFSSALEDSKRAVKAAGDDTSYAVQAHLQRAALLSQMSGKPSDNKLKEAEAELHEVLAVDPSTALAHFDLGFVLLKQGRDDEGVAELKQYLAAPGADPATVEEARRYIASPIRAREPFAPDFSFTAEDKPISNAALRGKVVMLDFWGTWCPACREAVPCLRNIQKKYSDKDFLLVGVSSDDDQDVLKTFVQSKQMDWPEYLDDSGAVQKAFKIDSFPTYVVIDKDGVIRFRQAGYGSETQGELEDVIGRYLKKASDPKMAAAVAAATETAPAQASVTALTSSGAGGSTAATADLDVLEMAVITGNVYRNEELSLTYQFPQGWIPAKPESLHAANQKVEAMAIAALQEQHPEAVGRATALLPRIAFYVSRSGRGDGQQFYVPSLTITALPTRAASLDLARFAAVVQSEAAVRSLKAAGNPLQMKIKDHAFVRADFESTGSMHYFYSQLRTLDGDYIVKIDLYAASSAEMNQMLSSLQSLSIDDN